MIPKIVAMRPHNILNSGRTSPFILEGMDGDGNRYEVVVKLFTSTEGGERAKVAELFCSLLGKELGMNAPAPYLVEFPEGFDTLISDKVVAGKVKAAKGFQYASHYYRGMSIVPPNLAIPSEHEDQAASIMTFDGLIQNPDRRIHKPNLLKGDEGYFLIDHDMALNMFDDFIICGSPAPWETKAVGSNSFSFLKEHLFNRGLKHKDDAFTNIDQAISKLDDDRLLGILEQIPIEWWSEFDKFDKIKEYFSTARNHSAQIVNLVKSSILS